MTEQKIHLIKALVSSGIRYFKSILSVIPVDGTFYVDRKCKSTYTDTNSGQKYCKKFNTDTEPQVCGTTIVPEDHYRNAYRYFDSNKSTVLVSGGRGTFDSNKNILLIVYVSVCVQHQIIVYYYLSQNLLN